MFKELVAGAGCVGGGAGKRVDGVFPGRPNADQWTIAAQGERRNGAERRNKGRNVSWRKGSLQKKLGLDYGMQNKKSMPERDDDGKDQGKERG